MKGEGQGEDIGEGGEMKGAVSWGGEGPDGVRGEGRGKKVWGNGSGE